MSWLGAAAPLAEHGSGGTWIPVPVSTAAKAWNGQG